jgi:hypothetical protein
LELETESLTFFYFYFYLVLVSACKQLKKKQAVAWILKTKEKKIRQNKKAWFSYKRLCVHWVGQKAENQRKTREKSKVAENPSVLVGFLRQKKD